jgi:hypothetical protein
MTRQDFERQIEEIVAAMAWGKASAAKRGRNPSWPFVPVIDHTILHPQAGDTLLRQRTENACRGVAFATREEAVAKAQQVIDARKVHLASQLADPRYRALRVSHGLPSEIGCPPSSWPPGSAWGMRTTLSRVQQ